MSERKHDYKHRRQHWQVYDKIHTLHSYNNFTGNAVVRCADFDRRHNALLVFGIEVAKLTRIGSETSVIFWGPI
jgi:hypothetical protein